MQNVIHDAVLADGCGRSLRDKAEIIKAIGLDDRTVGVGDLVRLGVQQVQDIEMDAPSVLPPIADARIDDAGGRRAERVVLGERACSQIPPTKRSEVSRLLANRASG